MYKSAFGRTFFGSEKKKHEWTNEEREELSAKMKESWANSGIERHELISETMTNTLNEYYKTHRNYWYGRKRTPEQIAKATEAAKIAKEHKRQEKIAKGELVWDENKEKYVNPKYLSKRLKIKNVRCIENGKVYATHLEAAKDLGLKSNLVKNVLQGKLKSTHGYHFEIVRE